MEITLTIKEEDKELYNFLKECKEEKYMKSMLSHAAELYRFCCGSEDEMLGYHKPESFKERVRSQSVDQLTKLKQQYLEMMLAYAQDFHPDEVDCGVRRGPDDEYWFVDDGGRLGFISLYANYIKEIDNLLREEHSVEMFNREYNCKSQEDYKKLFECLSNREERVIRLRNGLDDNHPKTLFEVAQLLGVTREKVRQIESTAIKKMLITKDYDIIAH